MPTNTSYRLCSAAVERARLGVSRMSRRTQSTRSGLLTLALGAMISCRYNTSQRYSTIALRICISLHFLLFNLDLTRTPGKQEMQTEACISLDSAFATKFIHNIPNYYFLIKKSSVFLLLNGAPTLSLPAGVTTSVVLFLWSGALETV